MTETKDTDTLQRELEHYKSLLDEKESRLKEYMNKCARYERIAKERAQRARKKASDPSGYACIGIREIIDYYEIELEDGSTVRCTGNHLFLLKTGEYKRADELTLEDELEDINPDKLL